MGEMAARVSSSILMSTFSLLLALLIMRLFYFFGAFFAVRGIVAFSRIVKSDHATRKRDAYACVVCILMTLINVAGIILTPILAK